EEQAMFGFDGEVGWRVPIFPADGDMDLRVFLGGYYFAASDVDSFGGPRGRIEFRLYDLDLLGLQSRLTVDGTVQWDDHQGVQGWGGLELRIPLGGIFGTPAAKLSPLDRRMVDRVQRDINIVTRKFDSDPEDVIVDELTVKTHTIVFATEGGTGNGTKNNPTNIEDAIALGASLGKNAIIVVDGNNGPIDDFDNPIQLAPGQALLGGDSVVPLHEAHGGATVNFHAPGDRPTLVGDDSTLNLVQMAGAGTQNEIVGLNLNGAFANGV